MTPSLHSAQTNTAGYKNLQMVSLLYITIPTILFIAGWLRLYFSIPLIILVFIGIYLSLYTAPVHGFSEKITKEKINRGTITKYAFIIAFLIFTVICAGVGGFTAQDSDHNKHNAFFKDLIEYPWPIGYQHTGPDYAPRVLNTYIGYYLPSALVGKIFGWAVGYFFSFLWVCIGLFLTILWLQRISKGRLLYLTFVLLFFSGLDIIGWEFFLDKNPFGEHYNYSTWMLHYSWGPVKDKLNGTFWLLGSNHTAIGLAPHHIFPSWICILMIFYDATRLQSNQRILFIAAFLPLTSAFVSIGMFPFVLLALYQNGLKGGINLVNLVIAPLLVVVGGLFLLSNNTQFVHGWIWDFVEIHKALPSLLLFYVLGFGLYFIALPKSTRFFDIKELQWVYLSAICILIFPIYRMGLFMDFPNKGFLPSWIIIQVCIAIFVSRYQMLFNLNPLDKIRFGLMLLLLILGSVAALSNIFFALKGGIFWGNVKELNIPHIDEDKSEQSLQLFSDGRTFFWKHLAKEVIYQPSDNFMKDRFGNTFVFENEQCNPSQGYYILVNGSRRGCASQLNKNEYGLIVATTGYGDKWLFNGRDWVCNMPQPCRTE
ncbi:MAG: hypothetical protein RIB47_11585 [Cyclobacteriaceae bacterium]